MLAVATGDELRDKLCIRTSRRCRRCGATVVALRCRRRRGDRGARRRGAARACGWRARVAARRHRAPAAVRVTRRPLAGNRTSTGPATSRRSSRSSEWCPGPTSGVAVIGVGIDAVDVARFRKVIERRPRLLDRVFTPAERERLAPRYDPIPGLAARFAAKEAAMKALGVGLGSVGLAELEIFDLRFRRTWLPRRLSVDVPPSFAERLGVLEALAVSSLTWSHRDLLLAGGDRAGEPTARCRTRFVTATSARWPSRTRHGRCAASASDVLYRPGRPCRRLRYRSWAAMLGGALRETGGCRGRRRSVAPQRRRRAEGCRRVPTSGLEGGDEWRPSSRRGHGADCRGLRPRRSGCGASARGSTVIYEVSDRICWRAGARPSTSRLECRSRHRRGVAARGGARRRR